MAEHLGHLFSQISASERGRLEGAWGAPPTPREVNRAKLFDLDDLDAVAADLARINSATDHNVYVSAGIRRPDAVDGKRASDAAVASVTAAWVDFDGSGDVDRGLAKLRDLGLEPTLAVQTGAFPHLRAQAWFLLDIPTVERDRLVRINQGLAQAAGGDPSVTNPSRVMRLAGSIAWPVKPNREMEATCLRPDLAKRVQPYSLEELERALATAEPVGNLAHLNISPTTTRRSQAERFLASYEPGEWHNNARDIVARMVREGSSDETIAALSPAFQRDGHTLEETTKQLLAMATGARAKGYDAPRPISRAMVSTVHDDDGVVIEDTPDATGDRRAALDIFAWKSTRFTGEPPPMQYLVTGSIPLAVPGLLVSQGDTGKSMIGAELCRRVAFGSSERDPPILGGHVEREGTAVFITSEDDEASVHRRLANLDSANYRHTARGERLIIVPLPNAGGSLSLFQHGRDGMVVTDKFKRLRDQLQSIDDLAVVVFDPLQAFVMGPINEDPAAGQFVCTETGALATETGATVLYAHHMRKPAKSSPIKSLQDAREAVRGTTALIDGVRVAFALWPAEDTEAKANCKELGMLFEHNAIVKGGIIKSNGPARRIIRTFARNRFGLLIDVSHLIVHSAVDQEDKLDSLVLAIRAAAEGGQPFTKTGVNGVYEQRARLPADLQAVAKHKLPEMVEQALERRLIVQAMAPGAGRSVKWLDVPGGLFAIGCGTFAAGAQQVNSTSGNEP